MDNHQKPVIQVVHHELTPVHPEANKLHSLCPACREGVLIPFRDPQTLRLGENDLCTACGQRVLYKDINDMRSKDYAR